MNDVNEILTELYQYDGTRDPGPMIERAHEALARASYDANVLANSYKQIAERPWRASPELTELLDTIIERWQS